MRRRLSAIFSADLVGYSRLMEIDEVNTLSRLKSLHINIELSLLAKQKFDFPVPFFVTHHEVLFSP